MNDKPPHVERMEAELGELNDRAAKLAAFIDGGPIFNGLSGLDQDLLRAQHAAMDTYCAILSIRLERAREIVAHAAGAEAGAAA